MRKEHRTAPPFIERLNQPELFLVVSLDVLKELDINNLSYADDCWPSPRLFLRGLKMRVIALDPVHFRLETWFSERVEKQEKTKDYAAEIKAGLSAQPGIPFLERFFPNLPHRSR